MIEFSKITIQNFGCIKKAEIDLSHKGLVLIIGENADTTAADSNGSGKSTIFAALSWVLYGKTVTGLRSDSVIRDGQNQASVLLEIVSGKDLYRIIREKTIGKAEKLRIKSNKKSFGLTTLKESQEFIEKILGLDWLAFSNTVLYGQGDIYHFADTRTTDAQRKAVLSKILRLEIFENAKNNAKEELKKTILSIDQCDHDIEILETKLESFEEAPLKHASDNWERDHQEQIERIQFEIDELKDQRTEFSRAKVVKARYLKTRKGIEEILSEYDDLREERLNNIKDRNELINQKNIVEIKIKHIQNQINEIENDLSVFEDGYCPTCKMPADSEHIKKIIEDIDEREIILKDELKNENSKIETYLEEIKFLDQKMEEIEEELSQQDDWERDIKYIDEKVNEAENTIARMSGATEIIKSLEKNLKGIEAQFNPFKKQLEEAKTKAKDIRKEINFKVKEKEVFHKQASVRKFWVEGFGQAGLPSYLLDSVVPTIALEANKYLEILSDGDLRIDLKTTTALKTGRLKEKINLQTVVEGVQDVPLSGGQSKKVTLACDLALMDLVAQREGSSIDILLLDEVLDGLDPSGKSRVMDLLEHLRNKRKTIFVISHDPEIAEKFNKTLTIVKNNGASIVR